MHLSRPRLAPLDLDRLSPAQATALAPVAANQPRVLNIFRTLAHAPEALSAFLAWGSYVLSKQNSLPAREREIVVLRIGWLCRSGYEWTQHVPIGQRAGLTGAEIAALKQNANVHAWSAADSALIAACDDLHARQHISDATWTALKTHFSERQCMDVVFTAGQYTQVSMMLNTFGVPLDDGQTLDPDLDRR